MNEFNNVGNDEDLNDHNDKVANYSVKTTESVKSKFDKIAEETNLSKKDLFATMVELLEIKVSNEVFSDFSIDVEEFRTTTERMFRSFVNIVERSATMRKNDNAIHLDKLTERDQEIENLKDVINSYKTAANEMKESNKALEKNAAELAKSLEEKVKSSENVQLLADELKEKNESLKAQIVELKDFEASNLELKERLATVTKETDAMKKEHDVTVLSCKKQIVQLETKINKLEEVIVFETKQKELDVKAAAADMKEQMQAKIEASNEKYQAQFEASNEKHQSQINSYLERIEDIRKANEESLRKQKEDFNKERERYEAKIENLEAELNLATKKQKKAE